MSNLKGLFFLFLVPLVFIFNGCGGGGSTGDSSDANVTELSIVLPVTTQEVTTNNQVVDIEVRVIGEENSLYNTGNVEIMYPIDYANGRDVGSFASTTAAVTDGVATFIYTAPDDISIDTSDIVFKFYHEDNPNVVETYTITINPDQASFTNYTLTSSIENNVTMNLESNELIYFKVLDNSGNEISDDSLSYIRVTSTSTSLDTLEDSSGNTGNTLLIRNKNNVVVNVLSSRKSGLISLRVEAGFIDTNGNTRTIANSFSLVVLSGPPSAISLSYVSSENDDTKSKFIEKWNLTVTDKYSNPVDSQPGVSMGILSGYAQDSSNKAMNDSNNLYFDPSTSESGTLNPTTDSFTVPSDVFDEIDLANDTLVTFGDGYKYDSSGKWEINSQTSSTLILSDDYDGLVSSDLGFAVGHNLRQDTCTPGVEWVANVSSENDTIDEYGNMTINIEYDYYLVGKDVMLWVNLTGQNHVTDETVKIGEAKKITLRGTGLNPVPASYNVGYQGPLRINIMINDTVEFYKNANFSYAVVLPDDLNASVSRTSMVDGIASCTNDGVAYVNIMVNAPAVTAGSVTLEDATLLPTEEF